MAVPSRITGMIASANSFKPMTLKQVRQRLTELLRNGHASAKERRQRSEVAGVPEVAFRWIVPTRSCLDGNQPALIFPSVVVSHALQRLFLIISQCGQLLPMAGRCRSIKCDRVALGISDHLTCSISGSDQLLSKNAAVGV
jgi:hypothetical protein